MKEAQLVSDRNLALKLAKAEWVNSVTREGGGSGKGQSSQDKSSPKKTEFPMKQVIVPIKGNYQKNEPLVKRLSNTEFRARLDKGLCFSCNEKYSLGHRCKMREKRELILNEEESGGEEVKMEETEEVIELSQLVVAETTEIELKILTGLTSKGTMKLKGHVKGREVVILIDSGATNNFIHEAVAMEGGLSIELGTQFGVTVGDGTRCKGKGICRKVEPRLKEMTVITDFLVVELGNIDVVLGMQWLDTTGTMKVHWPLLTMTF